MKKIYYILIFILLLLIVGFWVFSNSEKDISDVGNTPVIHDGLNNGKEMNIDQSQSEENSMQTEVVVFEKSKNENTVKIITKEIEEIPGEPFESEIIIFDKNKKEIGKIDLLAENPFLQMERGAENRKAFPNPYKNFHLRVDIDKNINDRTTRNDPIPCFIGISFSAISDDFEQSSSVIKVFNENGSVVFDTGIVYNKNYSGPSVSDNGKYMAVFSGTYVDDVENYYLENENRTVFYDLKTGDKIKFDDTELFINRTTGYFNENNIYIDIDKVTIILDIKNKVYYLGEKEQGSLFKVSKDFQFYSVDYYDETKITNLTDLFTKHSL